MNSEYALALTNVFEKSNLLTIPEWARYLNCQVKDIENWKKGDSCPTEDQAQKIVYLLKNSYDPNVNSPLLRTWESYEFDILKCEFLE